MKKLVSLLFIILFTSAWAQNKIVSCVGNSITYGYGLASPSTQSYPAQLKVSLGSNWTVNNYGVSARTMLKTGDLPYWNEGAFREAKRSNPNFVMIELGTNDSKPWNWNNNGDEFVSNYKEMIQVFKNLSSKPDVWIGLVPPGNNVSWGILNVVLNDSVNKRIKQVAYETGVGLIDVYDALGGNNTPWFNAQFYQNDSIHPTSDGAAIIAQKVNQMLTMPKPQLGFANDILTASISAYAYQWYFNGTPVSAAEGGNQSQLTPSKSGTYKVSLKLNATNEMRIVSQELNVNLVSTVNVTLKNLATGLLIDGINRLTDGSNAGQSSSNTNDSQQWVIETVGSYVKIKNKVSGLYLDGLGSRTSGSVVVQKNNSTSNNQQWQEVVSGSNIKYANRTSGLYLDGMGKTVNGSDLYQVKKSSTNNQLWTITAVNSPTVAKMAISNKVQSEKDSDIQINFHPNSFVDDFKIETGKSGEPIRVTIFDTLGRKVETAESTSSNLLSMGAALKSGLYVVQVEEVKTGLLKTFKIVKK